MASTVELPIVKNMSARVVGDTWYYAFRIIDVDDTNPLSPVETPRNMTGCTAKLVIREEQDATSPLVVKGDLVSSPQQLTEGMIVLRVDQTDTVGVAPTVNQSPVKQPYYYNAEVTNDGDIITYYEGTWPVQDQVALTTD